MQPAAAAPSSSFTLLSSRLHAASPLSSSSSALPVLLSAWCPPHDLLCVLSADASLSVHRLHGHTLLTCNVDDAIAAQIKQINTQAHTKHQAANLHHLHAHYSASVPEGHLHVHAPVCSASSLVWRPDGKALAIGFHSGLVALLSIETKSIVHVWSARSDRELQLATLTPASVTCLKWINAADDESGAEFQQPSVPCFASEKTAAAASSLARPKRSLCGATLLSDEADTLFSALPPLAGILDSFIQLATPTGAVPSSKHSQQHNAANRHQRHSSTAPSAPPHTPSQLPGILHDTLSHSHSHFNILLVGDSRGAVSGFCSGTLPLFTLQFGSPIISLDWSANTGLISAVTRHRANDIKLHSAFCTPLITHIPELVQLTHQTQQVAFLMDYIHSCLEQVSTKWKAARKSFNNRVLGLSALIEEHSASMATVTVTVTDAASEMLEFLLKGFPSPIMQAFIAKDLSAGPMQTTMDGLAMACQELEAMISLGLSPAIHMLNYRMERLRAMANWKQQFEHVGLKEDEVMKLQSASATMFHSLHLLSSQLHSLKSLYAAFGSWFVSCIRVVNNEHDSSPALGPDATQQERDGQFIPYYGPFQVDDIACFIEQQHLHIDVIGQCIGDIGASMDGTVESWSRQRAIELTGLVMQGAGDVTSLYDAFQQFSQLFNAFTAQPSATISPACTVQSFGGSTHLNLLRADPLIPASTAPTGACILTPSQNIVATQRSVALHSFTDADSASTQHRLAFLWHATDGQQQLVTVVSYHSISSASATPSPLHHFTFSIPSTLSPDTAADNSFSQLVALDFYSPNALNLAVQFQSNGTEDQTPSCSSKMYLVELDQIAADEWIELTDGFDPSSSHTTLIQSITHQMQQGVFVVRSLEPTSENPNAIESRSRVFEQYLIGSVSLNPHRSLAAVIVAARGPNPAKQAVLEEEDEKSSEPSHSFLLQQPFKLTRRILILDMDEDEEVEEEVEGEVDATEQPADVSMSESASMMDATPTKISSARSSSSLGRAQVSPGMSGSMMLSLLSILCFLFLAVSPLPVAASWGDMDERYRYCVSVCSSRCSILDQAVLSGFDADGKPYPPGSDPFTVLPQHILAQYSLSWASSGAGGSSTNPLHQPEEPRPLTWLERHMFGWDCPQNCAYHCMHRNVLLRQQLGQPTVKYFGKWPFHRLWGTQEFFSSLFSILNAIPHIVFMREMMREYQGVWFSMKPLWIGYCLVYMNTWLWSTVFHARDFLWTERLDYFCASAGICYSLCIALIRILKLESWSRRIVRVFLPVALLLTAHISYLQFVHFDYGYNMKASLGVGVIHSILWIANAIRNWSDGYHWRMVLCTVALWLCAMLEVFDFPPYWGLLDAHAMWHGLTPMLGFLHYTWVRADIRHQLRLLEEERSKTI